MNFRHIVRVALVIAESTAEVSALVVSALVRRDLTNCWSWHHIKRSSHAFRTALAVNYWLPAPQTQPLVFGVPRTGQRRTPCRDIKPASQTLHGIHSNHVLPQLRTICALECGMLKLASVCGSCEVTAISYTAASLARMAMFWYDPDLAYMVNC